MTEAVYTATAEYIVEMEQRPVKHRVSVSGVLKRLGVSRSGYHAWKKRCPSAAEKHRGEVKEKILKIYEDSHQNYGAPKITHELWKGGEKIAVKTVANYMRQMGIKAQPILPWRSIPARSRQAHPAGANVSPSTTSFCASRKNWGKAPYIPVFRHLT